MDVGIDTEKTNPFEPGVDNPGADEDIEQTEMENRNPYDSSSLHRTYEETSFGGDGSDNAPLLEREENIDEALARIKCKFPNFNPDNSPFTFRIDDYGRVMVRLKRDRGKYYPLFNADDKLNDKLPKRNILVHQLKRLLKLMKKKFQDVTKE